MALCSSCSSVIVGSTKYIKRTNKGFICPNCQLQDRISSILSLSCEDEKNNQSKYDSDEIE